MVAYASVSSYSSGGEKRITVQGQSGKKCEAVAEKH
jgi:hypothetical protein